LPGRLASELPRLWLGVDERFVHLLIHHSRYLNISTEREPANAVFCIADLLFKEREIHDRGERKKEIEEEIEFIDPAFELFGEPEVTKFMKGYKYGEAKKKLGYFYEHIL
jgi:hypothetical protein